MTHGERLFRKFYPRCSLSFCFPDESEKYRGERGERRREREREKISSHGLSRKRYFSFVFYASHGNAI